MLQPPLTVLQSKTAPTAATLWTPRLRRGWQIGYESPTEASGGGLPHPQTEFAATVLAAIDASSGGGLPHLRFSIALFAARAGERGATRYHLYRPVGGGKWPKPKGGQRSPWPEIKAMMMLVMLMMVMRMLVMLVIYQFSGWRFAPTSRLLLGN